MIVEPLVGTRGEIVVSSEGDSARLEALVVDEARRLERIFTRFDRASALRSYREEGTTDVPELLAVIELAHQWHRRSVGAFHPGAQPLTDLWDQAEKEGEAPTDDQLWRVCAGLTLEPSSLDLNAIAKGWIAETALAACFDEDPAATGAWLNLGGDIVHRGECAVSVGIENPRREYDNVHKMATIALSNESMATSGGGRRWWTIDGVRYSKVLDPRSGRSGDRLASATVVAGDAASADALATVAVFLDEEATVALAAEVGAECFLVGHDGSVLSTSDRFTPV